MMYTCEKHGEHKISRYAKSMANPCPICRRATLLPCRFQKADLNDFITGEGLEAQNWLQGPMQNNLLILGPSGTGKTHLASAITIAIPDPCVLAKLITAREMSQAIIAKGTDKEFSERAFLIIDEIGRSFHTPAEQDRMFDVVNSRYNEMLPTVFVSNLKPEDLRPAWGDALTGRIMDGAKIILMRGEDRRIVNKIGPSRVRSDTSSDASSVVRSNAPSDAAE